MAKSQIKWTQEFRKVVYARITMEFGPDSEWGGSRRPNVQGDRYEQVLRQLADYLTVLSSKTIEATAIDAQIAWATTKQEAVTSSGYARQFVMNKAAALEMGFLTGPELPGLMLTEPA